MEAAAYATAYGMAAVLAALYWVLLIGVFVLQIIAQWKILVKTGEPGWKSLIPFVGAHTMYKKFWKPVYYWLSVVLGLVVGVVLSVWVIAEESAFNAGGTSSVFTGIVVIGYLVCSIVVFIWQVKYYLGMARSFGYGAGFAVGLVFLPRIFMLILAFSKVAYQGNTYVMQTETIVEEIPAEE